MINLISIDSENKRLIEKIKYYTTELDENSVMGRFLIDNELNIDNWYEALKYPLIESKGMINYIALKYGKKLTIPFWQDIADASKEMVALAIDITSHKENNKG